MARVMELFVIVNALCGIAAFVGVRFVFRRSRDAAKRGFDIVRDKDELNEGAEEWQLSEKDSTTSAGKKRPESLPQ